MTQNAQYNSEAKLKSTICEAWDFLPFRSVKNYVNFISQLYIKIIQHNESLTCNIFVSLKKKFHSYHFVPIAYPMKK